MKAQHKKILIGVSAVAGAYLVYRYLRSKAEAKAMLSQAATTDTAAIAPAGMAYPLKKGSTGAAVMAVQKSLDLTMDGIFGPKTEAAVKAVLGKTIIADDKDFKTVLTYKKPAGAGTGGTLVSASASAGIGK